MRLRSIVPALALSLLLAAPALADDHQEGFAAAGPYAAAGFLVPNFPPARWPASC